jgi:uncharacterized protein YndB with AHSA1/START domain
MTNDTMNPDTIERDLFLAQPVDRVWAALTEPAELTRWFPDAAQLDVRPGGDGVFTFDVEGGTVDVKVRVEAVEPKRRFAFWWGNGPELGTGSATLVEFTLEPADGGTKVHLLESGFAAMPDSEESRKGNIEGWGTKLGQLEALLA